MHVKVSEKFKYFIVFCYTEPSPGDLIVLFLSQAEVASNLAKEVSGKENIAING